MSISKQARGPARTRAEGSQAWVPAGAQRCTPRPNCSKGQNQQSWGKRACRWREGGRTSAPAALRPRYSLQPGISGCSLWLSQCPGGSRWRRSPADSAERTSLFFSLKNFNFQKKRSPWWRAGVWCAERELSRQKRKVPESCSRGHRPSPGPGDNGGRAVPCCDRSRSSTPGASQGHPSEDPTTPGTAAGQKVPVLLVPADTQWSQVQPIPGARSQPQARSSARRISSLHRHT